MKRQMQALKSEPLQYPSFCSQTQQDAHKVVVYNSPTVLEILGIMLKQDKPSLNEEALYQEEKRLYLLISPELNFQEYDGVVGMSLEIAQGLVLRALRKRKIPLGVENEFHKLFLAYSMD